MKPQTIFSLLTLLALSVAPAMAQRANTLIDAGDMGGFGGPAMTLSSINDRGGLFLGGGGAVIAGHVLSIGGFGFGLVSDVPGVGPTRESRRSLNIGYGGLRIGYTLLPNEVAHLEFYALIGGGGANYRGPLPEEDPALGKIITPGVDVDWAIDPDMDAFLVVEPGAMLEINVAENVRLGIGGGYRMTDGVELAGIRDGSLDGFSGMLLFKFGSF